ARAPEHDLVPSLDRIAEVCGLLGDPQKAFRAVHVTGTNGKTSTTRLVERLLREHGLRTGRFTSPHLLEVRERIAVDGEPLAAEAFVAAYDEVAPYLELVDARYEQRLTFFEVLVAMAYAAFADAPVDVAAVEVGMGGSWDATNAVDAQVAVVMPIALDHQRFLGYDVASIAAEKAGIIKPGAVAVLADQPPEAAAVLMRRCVEVGATPLREGVEFGVAAREVAVGGQLLTLSAAGTYEDVFLPLYGEHQAHNAAAAVAAVEALLGGAPLDADTVRAALADADSPGRLEVLRGGPTILVDAAHNPAGAAVLADAVREAFTFTRLVGIVGVLADKDAEGILGALEPVLDEVVVTRSTSPRAIDPEELAEIAEDVFGDDRVHRAARLDDAVDIAIGRAEEGGLVGGGVLATGSITLAADVRRLLHAR
ncbi:MAG TPA: folylpolyglutamate synthase/dihydrofolate synthase family protein, partial [Kineosporiaceae bacterium]|nr:folylpolyglutamate synthase/dihydrofolate synthase family protein [Kineosporiaceae bacterium]